jgi:hypothetical protein
MVDGSGISQSFFKYVRVSTRFTTCRAAAAEDRCDAGKMAEEILYWRRRVKRLAEAVGRSSARSHSFLWASGRTGSQVSAIRAGGVKPGRREIAGEISVRLCHTAPACRDDAHACGGFAMFDSYDELAAAHRENCRERRAAEAALQSEAAELHCRKDAAGLVHKTHTPGEVTTAAVTPPKVAPNETQIWWQWVDARMEHRLDDFGKAVGQVIGTKTRETREPLEEENRVLKRELELLRREAASLRDEVERERALNAKAADIEGTQRETEYDLLRRELAVLRGDVGVERGLQALQDAIAVAKSEVPKLPDIEARVEAKLSEMVTAQSCLRGELQKMKDRLSRMRVDQSVADYKLSEFMREQAAAPKTEIEFETSTSRFVMRDISPAAARALREFAAQVIDARDAGPIWLSDPAAGSA